MGDFARRAREMGVNYIGGCCGCKATHIREMAKALGRHTEQERWQADQRPHERDGVQRAAATGPE